MRVIHVAAAQMGPIQKADSREAVVKRVIALMDEAKAGVPTSSSIRSSR